MKLSAKQILGNVLFIAVLLLIVGKFLSVVAGTAFPLSVVASHSMEPALLKGDALPWAPCDIDSVETGDVVVFASAQSWSGEKLVVHRVAAVRESGGEPALITKGDANNYTDQAGPHTPEPPITGERLKGKAFMLGGQPLKIPLAGYPWLMLHSGVDALTRSMSWGQPQPGHHYGVFAPAVVAISLVVAGAVLWAPDTGWSARERLHDCIFGPERLSWKRVFTFIFLFYLVFLMIAASFSYDRLSASMAVGEAAPESNVAFGTLQANETTFPQSVSVVNPSMLPVHGMAFASGSIERFLNISDVTAFSLGSGERLSGNVTAAVPAGMSPGSYTGDIYIYSTPYWSLVPLSVVEALHGWHPRGAIVTLTLLSAAALASVTVLLLAALSLATERWRLARGYLAWRLLPVEASMSFLWRLFRRGGLLVEKLRCHLRRLFSWMDGDAGGNADGRWKPCAVSLVSLLPAAPLLFLGYGVAAALLAASLAGGVVAYAAGCRWRMQFMRAALLTTACLACFFLATSIVYLFQTNHSLLVPVASTMTVAGIVLLVFAMLAVPVGLLFWLPGRLLHSIRERLNPVVLLRGCDL